VPARHIREAGAALAGGGLAEALQERGGGAVVGDRPAGAAGPDQLGPVGLDAQAERVQRGGIAGVGLDQGHGLGHLLPGPLHRQHLLGAPTEPHHPGEQDLLEAGGQRGRAGAVAGQHRFLGEEQAAFGAGVDLPYQPGRWVLADQPGEVLGQLVTAEAAQLEPPHAAVAVSSPSSPRSGCRRCSSSLR
jgi:hypothetical protein